MPIPEVNEEVKELEKIHDDKVDGDEVVIFQGVPYSVSNDAFYYQMYKSMTNNDKNRSFIQFLV